MDFAGVNIHPGRFIPHDRVRLPALPQFVTDLHVFIGALIARIVRNRAFQAHVVRLTNMEGGDNIPPDPSPGQMIERRKFADRHIRRVIGGGQGHGKSEPFGYRGQHGNQQGRIMNRKLNGVDEGFIGAGAVVSIGGKLVRKKYGVKLASLQRSGNVLPHIGLSKRGADRAVRMGPRPDRMIHGAVNQKSIQMHHIFHGAAPLRFYAPSIS